MSDHYPIVRSDNGNVFHSMVFTKINKCFHLVTLIELFIVYLNKNIFEFGEESGYFFF